MIAQTTLIDPRVCPRIPEWMVLIGSLVTWLGIVPREEMQLQLGTICNRVIDVDRDERAPL